MKSKQLLRSVMIFFFSLLSIVASAQSGYWQQKVQYVMDVSLDVTSNKLTGKQKITYFNNSPDKLDRVFFHLYWNAFQPNSMMDARSRELGSKMVMGRPDWDPRVRDRIQIGRAHV